MRSFLICLGVLFFLGLIPEVAFSQPTGGGPGGPPTVPISGIEVLIALGGALGIRKFLKSRKKNIS